MRHFLPELRSDFNDYICRFVVRHRIQRQLDMRISESRINGVAVNRLDTTHFNVCHEPFDGCATLVIPAVSIISWSHQSFEGHSRIDIGRYRKRHASL